MQNIKEKILALSPTILFLIGITILGGTVAGGVYLVTSTGIFNFAKTNTSTTSGASTSSSPFGFNEPEQLPQMADVCGDGICGGNEELYQNVCPRDCGGVSTPPTINSFVATPNTVNAGKAVTLSWSSDAIFCAPADEGSPWGGRWPGGAPKGEVTTDSLSSNQVYSIACMSKDGGMATKSVVVSVIQPPPPKVVIIKKEIAISFTIKPTSIDLGKTATLSWSSTNANTCSASGDGASWGWSGTRPTNGRQTTPPLTGNQTYTIKCTGPDGSASKKVTVNVSSTATAPYVSLSALPGTIPYGEKATLAWIISDAESCTTSNSGEYPEWSGTLPSKSLYGGLKVTRPLTSEQTFTITCANGTGTATATTKKSVTILVGEPASCIGPSGEEVPSGSSVEAFQMGTVAYGETCVSEKRNCLNGKLSGSYTNQSCRVDKGRDCSLGDTTVKSGGTITAYKDATVPLGSGTCSSNSNSETRSCEDGTLSGSFTNQSCDVVYGNNNGPYIRTGACGNYHGGNGGNPDCTCGNGNIIAITSALDTCNFNSFASGGNNHFDCVYTCTLQPQKATSVQIANCKISTGWIINCTP